MLHFLSRDERYQCDRQCDDVLSDAMAALTAFDGVVDERDWRVIGRRDQLTVRRTARAVASTDSNGVSNSSPRMNVLATGFLRGSMAQVAEGLRAETDAELLATEALLSGSQVTVSAAAVLAVAERASARARFRFAGVKWYAWTRESRHGVDGGSAQQPLELLAYERMGVTHDNESREVAYHAVRSLDRPEWPLFVARAPSLRRTDLSLCFLFRAVADDLLECLVTGSYQARASSSAQRAADVLVAERVLTVTRSLRSYEAKKLSRLMDKARGRPVVMAKRCLRCNTRRSVLDPLRNCGICKKSVCAACRQAKRVFQLNEKQRVPETADFCNACLARAHLPSMGVKLDRGRKSEVEAMAAPPQHRVSLPANLEYQNYDRLLESYAQRRRPRAASAAPAASPPLLTSSSNESLVESSSSEDAGAPAVSPVVAMPDGQMAELRRVRETELALPLARTVVQEDLYLPPSDENSDANAANQAEAVFRHHRERQQQLELLALPNPLHVKMLAEQERRRAGKLQLQQAADSQKNKEGAAVEGRRRAMTVPDRGPSADRNEKVDRDASTTPWAVAALRPTSDAFRSDLYARF